MSPLAIVMQKKTQQPVQFEITEQTREAVATWVKEAHRKPEGFLFPSRVSGVTSSFDPSVFPDRRILGGVDWT
jgi:hypothetical protein